MANVYNTIYRGDFCNSFGDNIFIDFNRRMLDTDPVPDVTPIIFAGEGQSPLRLIYKDDGDYKITPINGSELVINIKAIGDFELSSMYTADEREWFVDVYGARAWQGWVIPDSCSEPFESKPYDVTIRATDALGTLKDVPFQNEDKTKYIGRYREREVLRLALEKTGLNLDLLIGVNTFEQSMDESLQTGALGQAYIDVSRFLDKDRVPFSCYDVIASILRRYSARIHQHDYKWQVVNVMEKSQGDVFSRVFSPSGTWSTNVTIGNSINAGGQDRTIHPLGNIKLAKAFLSSTGYYQYGYITNQLINGNFDTWTSKPTGLADDWITVDVITATMGIRQVDGVDTTDYFIIIGGAGTGYIKNTNDVQIREGDKGQISFDLYAPDAYGNNISDTDDRFLSILITDDLGKYYTNTGWVNTFQYYDVIYKKPNVFDKQISVRFDITPQENDFTINVGVVPVRKSDGTRYNTQINNVNVDSGISDAATQPPVGIIYREEQLVPQTHAQESILFLHGDDANSQRTSPITINPDNDVILPDGDGAPSQFWHRSDAPLESKTLLTIATDNELRMHSRPYRIFEAEFVPTGFDDIDINTIVTVDLVDADFIFLSGEFDWKKDIHALRFAEVLTDVVPFVSMLTEDYGKDKSGALVSSPTGISSSVGNSFVDLTGYAKLTDLPVKASDAETQTGTDDAKFVTSLKLKNWWIYIKTQAATISGLWNFTNNLSVGVTTAASRLHVKETSTTTGAGAGTTIEQAGTGDSLLQFILTGVARWVIGVDNSDSDKLKIGRGADWGTGTDIAINFTNGNVGIANTAPIEKLDVTGKARVSVTPTNATDVLRLQDLGLGWALYTDTSHTSGAPLVINSGVTSTITNNAGTIINSELPLGITSWYNSGTSKITPSVDGDSYILNIRFTAVSSSNTGLADVMLDVTGLGVIDAQTISLRKGAGSSQRINVIFDVYSLATFVANGGIIKLNSLDGNTSVYDITYKITRVYKAI